MQDPKTVRVDRPDEEAAQEVESHSSKALFDAPRDPVLEFLGGALGEGERDDGAGRCAIGQQVGDSLRDDLRLSGPRGCDDLEMAATVTDSGERLAVELRYRHVSMMADRRPVRTHLG